MRGAEADSEGREGEASASGPGSPGSTSTAPPNPTPTPTSTATSTPTATPTSAATPTPTPASTPAPPAFHLPAFGLAVLAMLGAPAALALVSALLDRAGAGPDLAFRLSLVAGALTAAALGALAGAVGRRVAFFEISAAGALLVAALLVGGVLLAPGLRSGTLPIGAWEQQGKLVLVLGLLLVAGAITTAAFVGSSLGFLLYGGGRFDASLSYELFVARAHLQLAPRTLLGLFLVVVTGLLPGLLLAMGISFVRALQERRAQAARLPFWRPRMPATLLMTLISIGGVAIGVWALTVVLSVMSGFEADLKSKILGARSHGVVLKYGDNDFTEWREVRDRVLSVPGIAGATPFVYSEVMLSADRQLAGAILEGVDPATVGTVLDLARNVRQGDLAWLDHPERIPLPRGTGGAEAPPARAEVLPGLVIGQELARSLRVFVGDVVNVISPLGDLGPAGPQPRSRAFRVAAIFYCGMYEYDSKFAYLGLADAQRFLATGDSVTGLELRVKDLDSARPVVRRVLAHLEGYPYRVKDWGELNRNLFAALNMEKVVMAVILGFIVLVASFTIVATLVMQVLDKRREIAVLRSMGAGTPSIMKIFVAEGLGIGAIGTAFGLLLGFGTCLFIDKVGIPLDPEVYYISNLPVRLSGVEFLLVALLSLAISYLATLYPATKAARLEPVEGLRGE
ncbi:MAG: ABC transporter permease [Deltaproteobacteria bacterium]|nr:ABC transporter permease [Deltaproteobacteria bacterium]